MNQEESEQNEVDGMSLCLCADYIASQIGYCQCHSTTGVGLCCNFADTVYRY